MKYLLTALIVFSVISIGCKKNSTNSNNNGEVNTFSTVNVIKENATEYFSFNNNSGSTNEASVYDVAFYFEMFRPPYPNAPEIPDPRFSAKNGLSIAVLEDINLEDVTEVPSAGEFVLNFISKEGEWYETTEEHVVVPYEHVYVVNTTDGQFPAFEITNYYDEEGDTGLFTIDWKYLSD